jgi:DNA-binding NtrC family response regulator
VSSAHFEYLTVYENLLIFALVTDDQSSQPSAQTTVLYVDDEEAISRAVSSWLTRKGHRVYTAADAAGAREVLRQHDIDGIFIDVRLGKESGVDLHQWIREHYPPLANRAVFVTGDAAPGEDLARALRQIGVGVLAKPFDLREIEGIVRSWL